MNNSIAAGIVTFNPDIERLKMNLDAIKDQVGKVYVFDNGSSNALEIDKICQNAADVIYSARNEGIAYALNRLFEHAEMDGFRWLLTLDQDSVCLPGLIHNYEKHLDEGESFTSLRQDINYDSGDKEDFRSIEVDRCITSGNLVSIEAWRKVKGFNERLFIDMVDIDFCFRLIKAGCRIIKIGFYGIHHEMGDGTRIKILGKQVYIGNYSAFRKYYIARNMIYVIRKYKLRGDYYSYKRLMVLFLHALLKEKDKWKRCRSMISGVIDGYRKYDYIDGFFGEVTSRNI